MTVATERIAWRDTRTNCEVSVREAAGPQGSTHFEVKIPAKHYLFIPLEIKHVASASPFVRDSIYRFLEANPQYSISN